MQRNKKIVLITYGNFPYGGASANLSRLFALALANQKFDINVIMPTGNYYGNNVEDKNIRQGKIESVFFKHLGFINHPKNYFGKLADNFFGMILPIFYLIGKAAKNELDVIIFYDTTFLKSLFIKIIKSVLKKKLVIILPEFYEKPSSKFISLTLIKWYSFYFGIKYISKYADGIVVLSTYLRDYIKYEVKYKKNILLMPNLTDPEKFELKDTKPHFNGRITIGYVGTPTRKDGVLDLIKSFSILNKKYPYTHLLIIGDLTNGETLIPSLEKLAKELLIDENVTFTGLISNNKIPELLNSCQILALTRPYGIASEAGFPTKLGEYFACKKPVVITKVGDMAKYFINEEHAILVEPENIESIVGGFESLITDYKLCEKLSLNAYNWMDENLNYVNQSKRISEFIDKSVFH